MRLPLGAKLASSLAGAAGESAARLPLGAELASLLAGTACGFGAGAGGSSVASGAAELPSFGTAIPGKFGTPPSLEGGAGLEGGPVMAPPLCLTMLCTSGAFDFAGGGGGTISAGSMIQIKLRGIQRGDHGDLNKLMFAQ